MFSSNIIYPVAFVASLAPGINAFPELVKTAEVRMLPIVSEFYIEDMERGTDYVKILPIGEKNRDCKPLSFDGYSSQRGVSFESKLSFEDDPTPGNSRPKGKQSFGYWKFDLSNQPNADSVYVITEHFCGFWNVRTKIGPFKIG